MTEHNQKKRVKSLKELREETGRTAIWVANAVGVTRHTVARWERGDSPGLDDAVLLSEIFGLSLDEMAASLGFTREWAKSSLASRIGRSQEAEAIDSQQADDN